MNRKRKAQPSTQWTLLWIGRFKVSSYGMFCTCAVHAFVPISWACKEHPAVSHNSTEAEVILLNTVPRREGLLALKLLYTVMDVLESSARRARSDHLASVQTHTSKASLESCDRVTPNMIYASRFSASVFFHSRSLKLKRQPRSYASSTYKKEKKEFGRVMAVTRETSRFSDGPMVESVKDSRWIRKQKTQYERKSTST